MEWYRRHTQVDDTVKTPRDQVNLMYEEFYRFRRFNRASSARLDLKPYPTGSFLILIVACASTVLYVNVPAHPEGFYTKSLGKVKWMVGTMLFSELVFAHAIEERSMAVDALETLHSLGIESRSKRK